MQLSRFLVSSAAEGVEAVRAQLGPDAIVVSVKQLPRGALGWLAGKARLEVLACVPEQPPARTPAQTADPVLLDQLSCGLPQPSEDRPGERKSSTELREILQRIGLLPRYAETVVEHVLARRGGAGAAGLPRDLASAREVLHELWQLQSARVPPAAPDEELPHVFVGTPGSGKTSVLCKWLTRACLSEARPATVWRLDGGIANTGESLSVYCEILGVPLHRQWTAAAAAEAAASGGLRFIDLPGVQANDAEGLRALAAQVAGFGQAQVHLVLNAAYATPLLLQHLRAFAAVLPAMDLVLTHLDEEPAWGKVWNFVIGTNCAVRFLSGGQNIPGLFRAATPEQLFPAELPR